MGNWDKNNHFTYGELFVFCHDNKERLKLKVPYVEITAFIIHINRSGPKLEKGQAKKFHYALFNFLGRASLVNKRVTTDRVTMNTPQPHQQKHSQHLSDPQVRMTDAAGLFN